MSSTEFQIWFGASQCLVITLIANKLGVTFLNDIGSIHLNGLSNSFYDCHSLCEKNWIVPNLVSKAIDDPPTISSTDIIYHRRVVEAKSWGIIVLLISSFQRRLLSLVLVFVLSFIMCVTCIFVLENVNSLFSVLLNKSTSRQIQHISKMAFMIFKE